jgi:hypothetical protein
MLEERVENLENGWKLLIQTHLAEINQRQSQA